METPKQPVALQGNTAPRVMASSSSVVQQARLMESAGTAWHAVKCGNLEVRVGTTLHDTGSGLCRENVPAGAFPCTMLHEVVCNCLPCPSVKGRGVLNDVQ